MMPRDETFWLGQSVASALRAAGWIEIDLPPPPKPTKEPPAYICTLPGVSYDQRNKVLKTALNYTRGGPKRSIYFANASPSRENEERLSRMWLAARAVYQAGGDVDAIRAAAKAAGIG